VNGEVEKLITVGKGLGGAEGLPRVSQRGKCTSHFCRLVEEDLPQELEFYTSIF
jgi:hypothetical protein